MISDANVKAGPKDKRRDHVIYYTYKADRARRTLPGIDEQAAKAAKAVAGLAPVKPNRFIQLKGAPVHGHALGP